MGKEPEEPFSLSKITGIRFTAGITFLSVFFAGIFQFPGQPGTVACRKKGVDRDPTQQEGIVKGENHSPDRLRHGYSFGIDHGRNQSTQKTEKSSAIQSLKQLQSLQQMQPFKV